MDMTTYDHADVNNGRLEKISEVEAREFLESEMEIILRISQRDFYRVRKLSDLNQAKRLKDMGVYECFETYLE